MFDPDLVESMPEDLQKAVKVSIRTIVGSGLVDMQLQRMFERLLNGDYDQKDDSLANDIKDYRWKSAGLLAFKQFGESTIRE